MKIKTGDVVLNYLIENKVKHVFLITGGAIGFLILGLGKSGLPVGSIGYINIPSLIAMGVTSLFTAPIGAKWAHSLDEDVLKRLFGIYLVAVSLSMFWKASQI